MYLGEYYKSCEKMMEGQNWDKTNTLDMVNTRAFFSMAVTDRGIYAFGGEAQASNLIIYHLNWWQATTTTRVSWTAWSIST